MTVSVSPSIPNGSIRAIPSKSVAHRALICAAFADRETVLRCEHTNKDIEATAACLRALGAIITRKDDIYHVLPISTESALQGAKLPCGESGSTLRFLLPVVAALGIDAYFIMEGRLPQRPLSPLGELLIDNGVTISYPREDILHVTGRLTGSEFSINGGVSSQFISGLLFALTLRRQPASLSVSGKIESAPYLHLTENALSTFGAKPLLNKNTYTVSNTDTLRSPGYVDVEGDWSNAAFPLCLGLIGTGEVRVSGLDPLSCQGDREIIDILRRFGGNVTLHENVYTAKSSSLRGIEVDASQIPDLVPIIATIASVAQGKTVIYGASRLRLKESDRLQSISDMLNTLNADVQITEDGLIINGHPHLKGGRVSSVNDHRIAMSAAVASVVCDSPVIIDQADAVSKSYPSFWDDMKSLGLVFS